ncbi:hypothetical protein [Streptomyces tailanensis]|uniref:hypothetical protein n=1 Tax=Streptomyces tailanensis TaxID=2569858 RepID=UPI00122E4170
MDHELWLDDSESIFIYMHVWRTLRESAVYGMDAHGVISRARQAYLPHLGRRGLDVRREMDAALDTK